MRRLARAARPKAMLAGIALTFLLAEAIVSGAAAASARTHGSGAAFGTGEQAAATAPARPDGDTPAGFWYGTDSDYVRVIGPAPYRMPVIGGAYGGYVGMTGNWARWRGCGGHRAWSSTNSQQARTNFTTYHKGVGVGVYWFMAGPGVDPRYNGTASEAYAWGQAQAKRTLYDLAHQRVTYPVVFMDVELPGHAPRYTPAPDNGWNSVYTSPCSGKVRQSYVPARVDRADFDGFAAYLTRHSAFKVGVYSAPDVWRSIFGTGISSSIPNTYEWTYLSDTSSLAHPPSGWCLKGTSTCARFFGGITRSSKYAVMWQWSGGGGTHNGYGDFDQIDGLRTP